MQCEKITLPSINVDINSALLGSALQHALLLLTTRSCFETALRRLNRKHVCLCIQLSGLATETSNARTRDRNPILSWLWGLRSCGFVLKRKTGRTCQWTWWNGAGAIGTTDPHTGRYAHCKQRWDWWFSCHSWCTKKNRKMWFSTLSRQHFLICQVRLCGSEVVLLDVNCPCLIYLGQSLCAYVCQRYLWSMRVPGSADHRSLMKLLKIS